MSSFARIYSHLKLWLKTAFKKVINKITNYRIVTQNMVKLSLDIETFLKLRNFELKFCFFNRTLSKFLSYK